MRRIISISTICLLLDIISKQIVLNTMSTYQSIPIIKDFFSITLAKNTGVAFSLLEGKIPFISIMTIIVIGIILKYIKTNKLNKIESICYSFILAGAFGNLLDRLIYGYVIDFLDFNIFNYPFPIFNLADTMIVIGIFTLIIESIIESRSENETNIRSKNKNR